MAFALALVKLDEVLKEPGCPVCRMSRRMAGRAMDVFLWENINVPEVRQPIIDAYGLCPEHTRLLAATEISTSGQVLGVNIIYSHLARVTAEELRKLDRGPGVTSVLVWFKSLFRPGEKHTILPPQRECPVCEQVRQDDLNSLATLFEELDHSAPSILESYQTSDGLCLPHLRLGLERYAAKYPKAAKMLTEDAATRLERYREGMLEYIRKSNWEYRSEAMTAEESNAWRQALTFFTGYPGAKFTFHLEDL